MSSPAAASPPSPAAAAAEALAQKEGMAVILWAVGMFCILGWDWLTSLEIEIERIWKRKFTYVTWLYLLTRYYGLVKNSVNIVLLTRPITGIISDAQCENIFKWQPVSALISIQLTEAILGLRVYALYNKSRYVGAGLFLIMLANLGVQIKTMTVVFPIPEPPGVILPCIAIGPNEWLVAFWSMPLFFDTVVFALTLFKSVQLWNRDIKSRTINSFFRDGLIYFVGIFAMNLVNVVIFLTQDSTLKGVNLPSTLMLNIIMACRLVLNLRAPNKSVEYALPSSSGGSSKTHVGMGDNTQVSTAVSSSYYGMDSIGAKSVDKPAANVVRIDTFKEVDRSPPVRQWDDEMGRKADF